MSIDHINIGASSEKLKEVRLFYCNVLSLKNGFRPRFTSKGYWLYEDGNENAIVRLSERALQYSQEGSSHLDHVAINKSGLTDFVKKLDKEGIRYKPQYIKETELTQNFIKDPVGNKLEIIFRNERIWVSFILHTETMDIRVSAIPFDQRYKSDRILDFPEHKGQGSQDYLDFYNPNEIHSNVVRGFVAKKNDARHGQNWRQN